MTSSKGILPLRDNPWGCFTPWAVSLVFHRFHFVMDYLSEYTVKACRFGSGNPANGEHEYYNVKDGVWGMSFKVDLKNTKDGCSCHIQGRQQIPCEHIIAVLIDNKQYQKVWGFVGSVYSMESLSKVCRTRTKEEEDLYYWLACQEVTKHKKGIHVWRQVKKGNGKNKRRYSSKGDFKVSNENKCLTACTRKAKRRRTR